MFTNREFVAKLLGAQRGCRFAGIPSECPICRKGVAPIQMEGTIAADELHAEMCYRCTNTACERLFIARYERPSDSVPFQFQESTPLHYSPPPIPEEVREISGAFAEIYEQATEAEAHGLQQLVGMGLRKAAEFLVRDFLIAHPPLRKNGKDKGEPFDKDAIATMPFGNLVEHHLDNAAIRDMALRAWWLGSDGAHYARKYKGHDIEDLRGIIRMLMNWIESHILTAKLTASITKHGSAEPEEETSSPTESNNG